MAGAELGKKVSDRLALNFSKKGIYQIDKTRFLCVDVWQYLFNHRISQLKSDSRGSYHIFDE